MTPAKPGDRPGVRAGGVDAPELWWLLPTPGDLRVKGEGAGGRAVWRRVGGTRRPQTGQEDFLLLQAGVPTRTG